MKRTLICQEKPLIMFLILVLLMGCSITKNSLPQTSDISTPTENSTLSSGDIARNTETFEQEKHLSFDDQSGILISPEKFPSECAMQITFTKTNETFQGSLIVYDHETHEPFLWELGGSQNSFMDTFDLSPSELRALAWNLSPTHDWLSFEIVNQANDFTLNVYSPKSNTKFETIIRELTQAGYPGSYWTGADHYVVPLLKEDNLFKWLVWQPFNGEQSIIDAELPGIGDAPDQYTIFPMYLPSSGFVIYPCNQCDKNEYQAYDPESKQVKWILDFGEGRMTRPRWAFVPSPDGKRVVFYFGLNKLWIIDSTGESLVKISLPFAKSDNWVAKAIRWSPDGEQLAFIRDTPDGRLPLLTIVSIHENTQTSYCSSLGEGNIHWSYDGQYLIHSTQEQNKDGEITSSIFSIIHLKTGDGFQMRFPQNLTVVGWLK